jgi:hypothetical protein
MSQFQHECPDWDYLVIDASDAEFDACTCNFGPEAEEIKTAHNDALDAYNEAKDIL